jgi:Amt family ammonium transporter
VWTPLAATETVLNALLAAAAGGLIGLLYGWFLLGDPDPLWTGRSAGAGLVASLASLLWLTPLQAMLVGAIAAWIYILAAYLLHDLLGRDDPGDLFASLGLPALWGVLAVGFFAPAPGQFRAQLIGGISLLLLGFVPALVLQAVVGVGKTWAGHRLRWRSEGALDQEVAEEVSASSPETSAMR